MSKRRKVVVRKNRPTYKRPTMSISRMAPRMGPGNQLWATLIYANTFTLDSGASTTAVQQFSLNNLEDVDVTGGDAEPTGWDQLKAIYTNFTVTKCEYKIQAINISSGQQVVAVGVSDVSTSPSTARQVIENGSAQWSYNYAAANGSIDPMKTSYSSAVALDKLFGVSLSNLLAEDSYSHTTGTAPADQGYLNVVMENLDAGDQAAQRFYIELRYTVLCRGASLTTGST